MIECQHHPFHSERAELGSVVREGSALELSTAHFAHTALIVDSDQALHSRLVPALYRSLTAREPVLMVVSERVRRVVRAALGDHGNELQWNERGVFHQRLGSAFESFRRYLARQHAAGRRVHIVAESPIGIDLTTPVDRVAAYLTYESVCNDTFAPYECPVTCIWDSRRHPAPVIDGIRSLHNHELTEAGRIPNPDYVPPQVYLPGRHRIPLDPPPPSVDLDVRITNLGQLGPLRTTLRGWAGERAFSGQAADDVTVAVTEVTTNGFVHGVAPVRVRGWHHGGTLIAQIDDAGGRPFPATAGYQLPQVATAAGGRGLWLARQFADTVLVHTGTGHTSVRLRFPHGVTHRDPID